MFMKVSILGTGAFGIAFTKILNKNIDVSMWTNSEEELERLTLKRENVVSLPGIKIDERIELTTDIEKCLKNSNIIYVAVPVAFMREVMEKVAKYAISNQIICVLSKGIEKDTECLIQQIVKEEIPLNEICILAGASFAIDVATRANIGFVLASENNDAKSIVESSLDKSKISLKKSTDVVGIEVGSAIKNVFPMLWGTMDGCGENDSTKAAVLVNIINDFRLIIESLGGNESTVYSYAGLGDLLLTCMSPKSRNYTFGTMIGKGMNGKEAFNSMSVKTIEGLYTLDGLYSILKDKQVNVRSITLLYDIIYNGKVVKNILKEISK